MRLRVLVPVLLALAAAAGLILGAVLPGSGSSATPAAAGSSASGDGASGAPSGDGGSPATSPQPSDQPSASYDPGANNGSVSDANAPQPDFPVEPLAKGAKPPQFVVVSFDGACKDELFKHYLALAERNNAHFVYNLSGLCLIPDAKRFSYKPPLKPAGTSAIGFAEATYVPDRIRNMTTAYLRGDEIASHALGHFCGAGGVGDWSKSDWQSEFDQFDNFLDNWRDYQDPKLVADVPALPFNSSVIKGIRTPCLEGQRSNMWPVWKKAGFTYDASQSGQLEWPEKNSYGIWELPLQTIKIAGFRDNLSMDYNLMCAQNDCSKEASRAKADKIRASTLKSYNDALRAVCQGNRAPFFIGNHFNTWVKSAYLNSLTDFVDGAKEVCPDVQFVTNVDLVKWLDAQTPATLKALRAKGVQGY